MNLTLTGAFGRFGAKPASRLGSLSAMTADGAMVLDCCRGNAAARRPPQVTPVNGPVSTLQ